MDSTMFHPGDLNSGISRAITEQKVVACFVRKDDDHQSQIWEDFWLANKSQPTDMLSDDEPPLGMILSERAVLLKIEEGSQEASFLNAFCPITTIPTLVVIHNGQVLEKLEGGIGQEDFNRRLIKACGTGSGSASSAAGGSAAPPSRPRQPEVFTAEDVPEPTQATQTQPTEPSSNVQSMFSERGDRLEIERKKREAAEKAERIARATAKRKEAEAAAAAQSDKGKQRTTNEHTEKERARDAWIYQQKQRKDEAKKERERILNQIESDKQERRALAQRQKENETANGTGGLSELPSTSQSAAKAAPSMRPGGTCALQIRLFDGSSIRGKFDSSTTISLAVRTWVNEAAPSGGADIPYTFRQILAPKPSRSIEVSEEHQSLAELGLVPNATLVLVPVAGYTDAYASAQGGIFGTAFNSIYYAAGLLGSALSYIPGVGRLYMGGVGDEQEQSNVVGAQMAGADSLPAREGANGGSMKVKTMFDQRAEQEKAAKRQEFYNGNSSAFEGRKDDDDKKN